MTRVYTVTDASAFPALPLPAVGLVFLNGLFQSRGIDYLVTADGKSFTFRPGFLENGNLISVVSLT